MEEENIGMKDRNRERYEEERRGDEQEETNLDDNRPGNESVLIIDGSNPDFTRVDDDDKPSTSGIPDVRRDVANMKRDITLDKKRTLKEELGATINKGDGPNSTLIYDKIHFKFNEKTGKATSATYDGKELLVLRDGKLDYSKRTSESFINNFKEILRKQKQSIKKHQPRLSMNVPGSISLKTLLIVLRRT